MNYREKMRKAIECPQFGNIDYGEWGTLNLNQRKDIKRLLNEMDKADKLIKHQYFEIERLKNGIKELDNMFYETFRISQNGYFSISEWELKDFTNKLKELKEKE